MVAQESEAVKALKIAIEIEDQGLITYLKFARQTKDEFGKNIFLQLAIDEYEHRYILERQLAKILASEVWTKIELPKTEIERLAPLIRDKLKRTKGESGLNDVDALQTALELERRAGQFFRNQSLATRVPEAQALFLRLAEWEDVHYDIIQAELDTIQHTGFWFNVAEFKMDGKF
jgi:rubrerythrin